MIRAGASQIKKAKVLLQMIFYDQERNIRATYKLKI